MSVLPFRLSVFCVFQILIVMYVLFIVMNNLWVSMADAFTFVILILVDQLLCLKTK